MNRVILICGAKRSGKDVVADYLVEQYGYTKVKVATPLKRVVQDLFGFTDDQLETNEKDQVDIRWGVSPRRVMQFLGTDIMQYKIQELIPDIGRTFWIKSLIKQMLSSNTPTVVSDIRFRHECDMLKSVFKNVHIIRVVRNATRSPSDDHISEQEFNTIEVDAIIDNDNTIDHLHEQIDKFMMDK